MSTGWNHLPSPQSPCVGHHQEEKQEEDREKPGDGLKKRRYGCTESAEESCGRKQKTGNSGGFWSWPHVPKGTKRIE